MFHESVAEEPTMSTGRHIQQVRLNEILRKDLSQKAYNVKIPQRLDNWIIQNIIHWAIRSEIL